MKTEKTLTPLQYIKRETSLPGENAADWLKEWNKLSDEDKDEMKVWAEEERALV